MNDKTCEPRWAAIASTLIRYRYIGLGLGIAVFLISWNTSQRFVLNRQMESMFQADNPILKDYQQLQSRFGGNEVVLVVYSDADFWNENGTRLSELAALHDNLAKIDGVGDLMDLSVVDKLIRRIEQPIELFGSERGKSGIFSRSKMASAMRELFVGTTHSARESTIAIACLLEPGGDSTTKRSATIANIRAELNRAWKDREFYLVGEPVMVEEGFELIERDGQRLGWISSIVLAVMMLVVYRNIRWTCLTLLIVHWSLTVTRAICVWANWELTMVSSMLVAIVTVIGIATTMHGLFGYQRYLRAGHSARSALEISLQRVIRPVFWSCVTDAIAFSALLAARIEPVRDYGLMMAVASIVTLVAILLLGPGLATLGLSVEKSRPSDERPDPMTNGLLTMTWSDRQLKKSLPLILRTKWFTFAFLAAWLLLVAIGSSRLVVETDFLKNFRSSSPLARGYAIVEQQLEGAGVWDIMMPAPARLTDEYLSEVLKLENKLRMISDGQILKVTSLADAEAAARESPLLASLPIDARLAGMKASMPRFYDSLITSTNQTSTRTLRLMLRSSDRRSANEKLDLIDAAKKCVEEATESDDWKRCFENVEPSTSIEKPIVTGYFVLLSNLVQSVVADQWICFIVAALSILIALRLAIGDWSLALVALVPNTFPALGSLAVLGLLGMRMNIGAAMIAAVSIGLSVDSSIHYLIGYQRIRKAGGTRFDALEHCQSHVGMPVVISTLALVLGFGSLAMSDFLPTVVFGVLAAITMAVGLVGNLWWLPCLVDFAGRRR